MRRGVAALVLVCLAGSLLAACRDAARAVQQPAPPANRALPEQGPDPTDPGPGSLTPDPAPPPEARDAPATLDTVPQGAAVYVGHQLVGTTPLPFDRVPMYSLVTIAAAGHWVVQNQRLPERDMEWVRLTPLDAPSPSEVATEWDRLLGALRWAHQGDRWELGPLPGYVEHWSPSPDGRWLAVVLSGAGTPAEWGLDLLPCLDLAGEGLPRVLADRIRHPIVGADGAPSGQIPMRVLGWRGTRIVTLGAAERVPGAELVLAADEHDAVGGGSQRLGHLPLTIPSHRWLVNDAWLGRDAIYLAMDPLQRIDLLTGESRLLREALPYNESWGGVMAIPSPDGEQLLIRNGPLIDLATGREVPLLPSDGEHDYGSWSRDGGLLALNTSTPDLPGHWMHGADDSFMLPTLLVLVDRTGREASRLTLPTGEPMLSRLWLPEGALMVRAGAPPATDDAEVWKPKLAGLYLLELDGSARQVGQPVDGQRWLVTAGTGWAAEYDWEQQLIHVTNWDGAAGPPRPPGPVTEQILTLPDGSLAAVGTGGEVWVCAPGAAGCIERRGLRGWPSRSLQVAVPWLIGTWHPEGGTHLTAVRWDTGG